MSQKYGYTYHSNNYVIKLKYYNKNIILGYLSK